MNPYRRTTIALDFDRTTTSDIDFWRGVVELAVNRGHTVLCVTGRTDSPRSRAELARVFGPYIFSRITCCIFCNHSPKRAAVLARGYHVDIWIDDLPEGVGAKDAQAFQQLERTFCVFETLPILNGNPVNHATILRAV
jgi:hypothetical protein